VTATDPVVEGERPRLRNLRYLLHWVEARSVALPPVVEVLTGEVYGSFPGGGVNELEAVERWLEALGVDGKLVGRVTGSRRLELEAQARPVYWVRLVLRAGFDLPAGSTVPGHGARPYTMTRARQLLGWVSGGES
jgi:hypothetical protein